VDTEDLLFFPESLPLQQLGAIPEVRLHFPSAGLISRKLCSGYPFLGLKNYQRQRTESPCTCKLQRMIGMQTPPRVTREQQSHWRSGQKSTPDTPSSLLCIPAPPCPPTPSNPSLSPGILKLAQGNGDQLRADHAPFSHPSPCAKALHRRAKGLNEILVLPRRTLAQHLAPQCRAGLPPAFPSAALGLRGSR